MIKTDLPVYVLMIYTVEQFSICNTLIHITFSRTVSEQPQGQRINPPPKRTNLKKT